MDRNLTLIPSNLLVPKNETAGRAIMINSMTNGFDGKTIKTHKWRKWMTNTNKQNKTITALHNSRPTIWTIAASARIAITIVTPTNTNEQEMIEVDQTCVIAPTPKRAVRAAQVVITTETAHTSTMRKRSTKKQTMHNDIYAEPNTISKEKRTQKRMQRNRNITQKNRTP
jgi:hypothetical protein